MSNKALLVIDIQNDYFPGGKWTVDKMEAAAANAARLIADARVKGDRIIHVRHEFPAEPAPFFAPGSEGAQTHQSVAPIEGETTILKHSANSFRETGLKQILDGDGVGEVVICGAMSQMCIDATTRAAADFGYKVTLVHDACGAREVAFNGQAVPAEQVHAAFMAALGSAYATVTDTNAYLAG